MHLSLNPLGDNLSWLWDIIALVVTFGVIQTLVIASGAMGGQLDAAPNPQWRQACRSMCSR